MVLVIVLAIGVIACVWLIDRTATRAITSEPAPSSWDGRGTVGRCTGRTCTGVGTVTVVDSTDKPRRVCASCFERGIRLGWWASFATDRDLTHTEAREVHDDARRITGEAAGGGVA